MFYGDSITEQLRDLEGVCGLWGCPEGGNISRKVFGKWRSINLAIGGALLQRGFSVWQLDGMGLRRAQHHLWSGRNAGRPVCQVQRQCQAGIKTSTRKQDSDLVRGNSCLWSVCLDGLTACCDTNRGFVCFAVQALCCHTCSCQTTCPCCELLTECDSLRSAMQASLPGRCCTGCGTGRWRGAMRASRWSSSPQARMTSASTRSMPCLSLGCTLMQSS